MPGIAPPKPLFNFHKSPVVPSVSKAPKVVLFDVDQVARFLHSVAYAIAAAENTKLVSGHFWNGGDTVDFDVKQSRAVADKTAAHLMSQFSLLCNRGSARAVQDFLQHQRLRYIAARRDIDAVYRQVSKNNQSLLNSLDFWKDVTHIVHGTANATFGVLSFFVTGGGGGVIAGKALNIADQVITDGALIGIVKATRDEAAGHVAEAYAKRSVNTLSNIVTRRWKYQGALQNAQARLATQAGVAVGARTLSVYFAVEGIKGNFAEICDAFKRLTASNPAAPCNVASVPDLKVPLLK